MRTNVIPPIRIPAGAAHGRDGGGATRAIAPMGRSYGIPVMPAKAGIQRLCAERGQRHWTPASAGVTDLVAA